MPRGGRLGCARVLTGGRRRQAEEAGARKVEAEVAALARCVVEPEAAALAGGEGARREDPLLLAGEGPRGRRGAASAHRSRSCRACWWPRSRCGAGGGRARRRARRSEGRTAGGREGAVPPGFRARAGKKWRQQPDRGREVTQQELGLR